MDHFSAILQLLICGGLVSILLPLIGAPIVQKRLSNIGDALSHTSLAGVVIGLACGMSPLWMAVIIAIISSLIIEFIRKKFSKYTEISVVIVMSFAVGFVAIMSKYAGSGSTFSSYLFGAISLATTSDTIVLLILAIITILFFIGFYRQIFYVSYNELQASLDGIHVRLFNIVQTILSAVVIAVSSKIVGALIVSSLMVIPYAASLQITKSYKQSIIVSIILALISTIIGVLISYPLEISTSGTMIMVSVCILIILMVYNKTFKFNK